MPPPTHLRHVGDVKVPAVQRRRNRACTGAIVARGKLEEERVLCLRGRHAAKVCRAAAAVPRPREGPRARVATPPRHGVARGRRSARSRRLRARSRCVERSRAPHVAVNGLRSEGHVLEV